MRSRPLHLMQYWVMRGLLSATGSTTSSTGSSWYSQPISMTSREMVAENMDICLVRGTRSKIHRTSW